MRFFKTPKRTPHMESEGQREGERGGGKKRRREKRKPHQTF